jgi:branched-subunit amino acid aminotransferase/4-amino-4-deoxychorismate lyase
MSDATRSQLYGAGCFTTIRIIHGDPWLWDKHWRRLMHHAASIGLDLRNVSEDVIKAELDYALKADELGDGRARISLHDQRTSAIWPGVEAPDEPTTFSILTGDAREIMRPFRLTVSPHLVNSTSPLAGLKTGNYLEQTMSLDEARSRDANEAIRINERGEVTSACMANIFWLAEGRLFTPSLSTGCLPGTTREFVMENVEVSEVEAAVEELIKADAIFLSSAGLGVVQVDELDGKTMSTVDHNILNVIP